MRTQLDMFLKYCFVLILIAEASHCNEVPLVETPLGKISGSLQTSYGGRQYAAFEGIPFAKPPIGERRFEAPEPVDPWSGTWEANFLTECAQFSFSQNFSFIKEASEDCLHINVYVPRAKPDPKDRFDVIVHIHGGAFMYGSGHFYSKPSFLMDHDVIFVTFNYRLGALGFLSTEDDVLPGNSGLKDQVLALEWVQKNIASFGGNPGSVTLTGLSAGAVSVHFHYFSDMSKGLFHRGFSQSGCVLNPWAIQEEPLKMAKMLAEAVGCPTGSNQELVRCLKERPYKHLMAKRDLFYGYNIFPLAPFAPVVEKTGKKCFLKEDPYVLLTQGRVYDVPWITSNTAHEGFITMGYEGENLIKIIKDKWEELAPFLLDYNYTLPQESTKIVAKKVKEHYLKNEAFSEENLLQIAQIFSDRLFLIGTEIAVKEQAKITKSPVYYYYFGYPGDKEQKIVSHGEDAIYFFGNILTGKPLTPNELKMKDILLEMLVSYAKTGKPKIGEIDWKATGHHELTYLYFDDEANIKLKTIKELTPRSFWKSLGLRENENLVEAKVELL